MKKHGFTLAEVLVTLGIIGVVAALTLPTFTARTQSAKVGPALAKASASFSQSAKAMLNNFSADSLSSMYFCNDGNLSCADNNKILSFKSDTTDASGQLFWQQFSNFMSGSEVAPANLPGGSIPDAGVYGFQSADGTIFWLKNFAKAFSAGTNNKSVGSILVIDINGTKEPNKEARDQFTFHVLDNGTLLPYGSTSLVAQNQNGQGTDTWQTKCQQNALPDNAAFCAGHVFENGLKVEYK